MRSLLSVIALFALLCPGVGVADPKGRNSPDYPGRLKNNSGSVIVEMLLASSAIQVFHTAYERWPESWNEVVASGLVTVELKTPYDDPINLDDGKLDYDGDIQYDYRNGKPVLITRDRGSVRSTTIQPIGDPGPTYREMLTTVRVKFNQDRRARIDGQLAQLEDPARLLQVARSSLIRRMLSYCKLFKGAAPETWAEFQASGWCPLAPGTRDPFSGAVLRFDNRANDFRYVYRQDLKQATVHPLDANAETYWLSTS